ncbi:MAG: 3'-5' exonuclease [Bacteroidales bacterium]|jgi:DNA polymerase-3 subunit epsilon|nr:3'-5' exonuclease [Bacteroidales bacterium]
MKLRLTKPVTFISLATTGVKIGTDKIVEISMLKMQPDGSSVLKTYRINPQMPIPAEMTALHGISDIDVANEPTFQQLAGSIRSFLEGCDIAGYNVQKFDIPFLMEEFFKLQMEWNLRNVRVVDVQNIFHKMEPRTLEAAYRFYCKGNLTDAHSADADTQATYKVLESQLSYYEGKTRKDDQGNELYLQNDVDYLAKFSAGDAERKVDRAGFVIYKEIPSKGKIEVFNFGKYKGLSVADTIRKDPSFYDWMSKADFPLDTKNVIKKIKERPKN